MSEDVYSRIDYRRMVAWPARIRREGPFLRRVLEMAPERSVLDLGCGTGEHSRFLADLGYRVLGIDRSESMLEKAADGPLPPNLKFACAGIGELDAVVSVPFGAAICLGNTLAHLNDRDDLLLFLKDLQKHLLADGVFVLQILNYERVFAHGIRFLPLNFRADETGETVFLRLMKPLEDGSILFCPSTLQFQPDRDEPLQVLRTKTVKLRGWQRSELLPLMKEAGWKMTEVLGDMENNLYLPNESQDLVVVATRRSIRV